MSKNILAVVVKPGELAEIKEIDATLEGLQSIVGGYIEAIYPFEDEVALICNDEGKILDLPPNRPLFDSYGRIYDIVFGTFVIVGLTEEDFGPLSKELAQKYKEKINKVFIKEF